MDPALRGLIIGFDLSIAAVVILGFLFGLRWYYARQIAPSKKCPQGKIVAEFWTETGDRYRELCEKRTNGWEIKAPRGHKNPRYFFYKKAMGRTKYPLQPLLPFSFVQVDAAIVSWYENDPEPIDPKRKEVFLTAERLDAIRDDDSLATANAIDEEMAKAQQQAITALNNMMDKRIVYALLVVSLVAAALGAIFAYNGWHTIQKFIGVG
jgi:hypothetical protein